MERELLLQFTKTSECDCDHCGKEATMINEEAAYALCDECYEEIKNDIESGE